MEKKPTGKKPSFRDEDNVTVVTDISDEDFDTVDEAAQQPLRVTYKHPSIKSRPPGRTSRKSSVRESSGGVTSFFLPPPDSNLWGKIKTEQEELKVKFMAIGDTSFSKIDGWYRLEPITRQDSEEFGINFLDMAYAMKLRPMGAGEDQDLEIIITRKLKRPNNDLPRTGTIYLSYPYVGRAKSDSRDMSPALHEIRRRTLSNKSLPKRIPKKGKLGQNEARSHEEDDGSFTSMDELQFRQLSSAAKNVSSNNEKETVIIIGSYSEKRSDINNKSVSKRHFMRKTVSKYTLVHHQPIENYKHYVKKEISDIVKICDFYKNPQQLTPLNHNDSCYYLIHSSSFYDSKISGKINIRKSYEEIIKKEVLSFRPLLLTRSIIISEETNTIITAVKQILLWNTRKEKDKMKIIDSEKDAHNIEKISENIYPLNPYKHKGYGYIFLFSIISGHKILWKTLHISKVGKIVSYYHNQIFKSKRTIPLEIFYKRSDHISGYLFRNYKSKRKRESQTYFLLGHDNKSNYHQEIKKHFYDIYKTISNNIAELKHIYKLMNIYFDSLWNTSMKRNKIIFFEIYDILEMKVSLSVIEFIIISNKSTFSQKVMKNVAKNCKYKYSSYWTLQIMKILRCTCKTCTFLTNYILNIKKRIHSVNPDVLLKTQRNFSQIQAFYLNKVHLKGNDGKKVQKAIRWKEKKWLFFTVGENIKILLKKFLRLNDNGIFQNQEKIDPLVITSDSYTIKTPSSFSQKKGPPKRRSSRSSKSESRKSRDLSAQRRGSVKNDDLEENESSESKKSKDKSKRTSASKRGSSSSVDSKERSSWFGKNKRMSRSQSRKSGDLSAQPSSSVDDIEKYESSESIKSKDNSKRKSASKRGSSSSVDSKRRSSWFGKKSKKENRRPSKSKAEKIVAQLYHSEEEGKSARRLSTISGVNLSPSPSERFEIDKDMPGSSEKVSKKPKDVNSESSGRMRTTSIDKTPEVKRRSRKKSIENIPKVKRRRSRTKSIDKIPQLVEISEKVDSKSSFGTSRPASRELVIDANEGQLGYKDSEGRLSVPVAPPPCPPSQSYTPISEFPEQRSQHRKLLCGCMRKDYTTDERAGKPGVCGRLLNCRSKESNKCICSELFKCFKASPVESKKGICCASLKCSKTTVPDKERKAKRRCGICGSLQKLSKKEKEQSKKGLRNLFGCKPFGICSACKKRCSLGICSACKKRCSSGKDRDTTYGKFRVVADVNKGEIEVSFDKSSRKHVLSILRTLADECDVRMKKSAS